MIYGDITMDKTDTDTDFPSVSSVSSVSSVTAVTAFWRERLRYLSGCIPRLVAFYTKEFRKLLKGDVTRSHVDKQIIAYLIAREQELLDILSMPAGLLGSEKIRPELDDALLRQFQMFAKVRSPVRNSRVQSIVSKVSDEIVQIRYIVDFGRKIVQASHIVRSIFEHDLPNKTDLILDVLDIWDELSSAEEGTPLKYERAWQELCDSKPLLESMLNNEYMEDEHDD